MFLKSRFNSHGSRNLDQMEFRHYAKLTIRESGAMLNGEGSPPYSFNTRMACVSRPFRIRRAYIPGINSSTFSVNGAP